MKLLRSLLITTTFAALPALAEYVPDTVEFPASEPLVFASTPVLDLPTGGAIEFWVVSDWTENPGYHPVVLANVGAGQPSYQVSITAGQDALIVQAGKNYGQFPFDFSDQRTHHVALLIFDTEIIAMIDGKLTGAVAMSIAPGPTDQFYVGSGADGSAPFVGAVSALRIWDVPLEPEEIAAYALSSVTDTAEPHPNIDNLVAISNFHEGELSISERFVLEEELMTREETIAILGEEEVLAMELEFNSDNGENDE